MTTLAKIRQISNVSGRLLAVGDIHGCYTELNALMAAVKPTKNDQLVFVGDYIDRGLEIKKTIDYLVELKKVLPRTIFLRGNHEDAMLTWFGRQRGLGSDWIHGGGLSTVTSYGIDHHITMKMTAAISNISIDSLWKMIPSEHRRFFLSLDTIAVSDDYIFVHGGLDPMLSIGEQNDFTPLWIRDEFLLSPHLFGKIVVHGHTPSSGIEFNCYRMCIDQGCIFGGRLTCVDLTNMISYQSTKETKTQPLVVLERKI